MQSWSLPTRFPCAFGGSLCDQPSVTSIRILDANNQVLATGGQVRTRDGEVFVRDALQNEKKVGSIEITLIKPSMGEILRTQWLTILLSLAIHGLLWLAYRAIALKPYRYLARINNNPLKHEIQVLTQTLEQRKHHTAVAIAQSTTTNQNQCEA